ncbi:MAG: lipoprotein [Sinobacteraceae bacterium]|nr:lipoprotein [Nevskiaceae bacterium]
MPRFFILALSISVCAVLAACGQSGPLYLPSQGVPASQKPPISVRALEKPAASSSTSKPAAAASASAPQG